jgi:hypothetical protein
VRLSGRNQSRPHRLIPRSSRISAQKSITKCRGSDIDASGDERCYSSMSKVDLHGLDIEAILNDLYASEVDASISWIWDVGFHVALGDPELAEGWAFKTIGEAVAWLREEACPHYPDSDFAQKYGGFV